MASKPQLFFEVGGSEKGWTAAGDASVVRFALSMSESQFMMFCSMLLFDIDLLMRAGPGHPG